jgi:hypothetical protein
MTIACVSNRIFVFDGVIEGNNYIPMNHGTIGKTNI